jgi:Xaa-Pro aminopeptidase
MLLVNSFFDGWVEERDAVDQILLHETYPNSASFSARDNFLTSMRTALRQAGLAAGKARLAVEERRLPAVVLRLLMDEFPNLELLEAGAALAAARTIKTPREMELLRRVAEINKYGQQEFLHQCRQAGKNHFEIWAATTRALQAQACQAMHFAADFVIGADMGTQANGPKNAVTQAGEMALFDSLIRVNGYWSDTTNTVLIGSVPPTEKQRLYGETARAAFYAAVEALRPGNKARQVWEAANAVLVKRGLALPHHAGHQVGTTVNEEPRLLPFDESIIQAGMVFSVEPGAYEGPGGSSGARMEKQVIVHESGPEIFPDFEWGF